MAACWSLHQIISNPIPDPSLIESLSPQKQIKSSLAPVDHHSSFTEIFGELHFKEPSDRSSSTSLQDRIPKSQQQPPEYPSASIDSLSCFRGVSDSLQLCTEGLGFESSDDMDQDLISHDGLANLAAKQPNQAVAPENRGGEFRRSSARFPPPVSCVGRSGKAGVSFRSFRQDGRFVLKEVRAPAQELLRAHRENGRLRLRFVQPADDDGFFNEDEEENGEDDGDRSGEECECVEGRARLQTG